MGPSVSTPSTPKALNSVVMLPPKRPESASSPGEWVRTRDEYDRSRRLVQMVRESPLVHLRVLGRLVGVPHGGRVSADGPIFRIDAAHGCVGIVLSPPRVVKFQTDVALRIRRNDVAYGRRVELPQLLDNLNLFSSVLFVHLLFRSLSFHLKCCEPPEMSKARREHCQPPLFRGHPARPRGFNTKHEGARPSPS